MESRSHRESKRDTLAVAAQMMALWSTGKETWLLSGVMRGDGKEVGGSERSLEGWKFITN